MSIKPGDVVLLKSGGPSMTVVSVGEDEIGCIWIGDEGEPFRETFPPIALDMVETDLEKDDDEDDDDDDDEDEDEEDDEVADGHEGADDEGADADAEDDEMVEPEHGPLRRAGRK
jgi:uncharacterized protein YodC (DUF2158 family)